MAKLRVSWRKSKSEFGVKHGYFEGVLRDEKGKAVWCCGHDHMHKDGAWSAGKSAEDCARYERDLREGNL